MAKFEFPVRKSNKTCLNGQHKTLPTWPVVQHRVTHLAKVTFVHEKNCPGAGVVLRMLIINSQNKFPNKTLQKAQKIGKLVYSLFSVTIYVKTKEIKIDS